MKTAKFEISTTDTDLPAGITEGKLRLGIRDKDGQTIASQDVDTSGTTVSIDFDETNSPFTAFAQNLDSNSNFLGAEVTFVIDGGTGSTGKYKQVSAITVTVS